MQAQKAPSGRIRRTVNDLVMAEMFLVQATIESATAIGEGIEELSKKIADSDTTRHTSWKSLSQELQRIGDEALEPYTSRYKYFKDMIGDDS
ncbi:MAG: hypothetical protein P8J17_13920 [Halioglobus sp.]|jgi:hypothetical protein|nr:hypothetical protein [Halioglobus sp.]